MCGTGIGYIDKRISKFKMNPLHVWTTDFVLKQFTEDCIILQLRKLDVYMKINKGWAQTFCHILNSKWKPCMVAHASNTHEARVKKIA